MGTAVWNWPRVAGSVSEPTRLISLVAPPLPSSGTQFATQPHALGGPDD